MERPDFAFMDIQNVCTEKVSVLMGVYNCEKTVGQAIHSIQKQTYQNWELIICDDGSTDDTFQTVAKEAEGDKRIILLRNQKNIGLNKSLNNCLEKATGSYIARMDGDDECISERFERQVTFLRNHPEYEIVSSPMIFFDEKGDWGRNYVPEKPAPEDVVSGSPICHAPVMLRKECMDTVGGYTEDQRVLRVEDVDLWIKLYAEGYRCYNIQKPMYRMRNDVNALHRRKYIYRINSTIVRLKGCKKLGLSTKYYLLAFKPMIYGLVPAALRMRVKKRQSRQKAKW